LTETATQTHSLVVNGAVVTLLPEGGLWWATQGVLVFADLHFEKGSSYGIRGQFLPPYDTRATIERIEKLISQYAPQRVIALGDSFHDKNGPERLCSSDGQRLTALTSVCDWIWITGNHDADSAAVCGGRAADEVIEGPLVFRHEPVAGYAPGEICGHLHPKAGIVLKRRYIRRACFVSDGARIVMPAFGAYTGGLDVFDAAFSPMFPRGFTAYLLGRDRIYPITDERLSA
jgi:DNA ligase-associated metallophosphoesterase